MSDNPEDPIEFEINGELDLHTFRPQEVGELVPDYIGLCQEKGITRVRIIHGKGIGTLRETVHAILKKDSRVARYQLADPSDTDLQNYWRMASILMVTSTSLPTAGWPPSTPKSVRSRTVVASHPDR